VDPHQVQEEAKQPSNSLQMGPMDEELPRRGTRHEDQGSRPDLGSLKDIKSQHGEPSDTHGLMPPHFLVGRVASVSVEPTSELKEHCKIEVLAPL
jgi:hypothetical protein